MILSSVAERLNEPIGRVVTTLAAATEGTEWDFMTEGSSDTGVFSSLISKLQDIGASGYQLMMTLGIIGLVFSIIFTAVSLLLTSNAQKKEEKKSHALVICLAGIIIFSVFSIIGFFSQLAENFNNWQDFQSPAFSISGEIKCPRWVCSRYREN